MFIADCFGEYQLCPKNWILEGYSELPNKEHAGLAFLDFFTLHFGEKNEKYFHYTLIFHVINKKNLPSLHSFIQFCLFIREFGVRRFSGL